MSQAPTASDRLEALRAQLRAFVCRARLGPVPHPEEPGHGVGGGGRRTGRALPMAHPGPERAPRPQARAEVELEIADVLLFLLRLCDQLDVDPLRPRSASSRSTARSTRWTRRRAGRRSTTSCNVSEACKAGARNREDCLRREGARIIAWSCAMR